MVAPDWTCPECDTLYSPGFSWALDRCAACEEDAEEISLAEGDVFAAAEELFERSSPHADRIALAVMSAVGSERRSAEAPDGRS